MKSRHTRYIFNKLFFFLRGSQCTKPAGMELTNERKRSCGLTSIVTNSTACETVFIPTHFSVQGDCFGELRKVH